jgi:hypothetical protein
VPLYTIETFNDGYCGWYTVYTHNPSGASYTMYTSSGDCGCP